MFDVQINQGHLTHFALQEEADAFVERYRATHPTPKDVRPDVLTVVPRERYQVIRVHIRGEEYLASFATRRDANAFIDHQFDRHSEALRRVLANEPSRDDWRIYDSRADLAGHEEAMAKHLLKEAPLPEILIEFEPEPEPEPIPEPVVEAPPPAPVAAADEPTFDEPKPWDRFDVMHEGQLLADFDHPREAHAYATAYRTSRRLSEKAVTVVPRKRFRVFANTYFVASFDTHEEAQAWADQKREQATKERPQFAELYEHHWTIQDAEPPAIPPLVDHVHPWTPQDAEPPVIPPPTPLPSFTVDESLLEDDVHVAASPEAIDAELDHVDEAPVVTEVSDTELPPPQTTSSADAADLPPPETDPARAE